MEHKQDQRNNQSVGDKDAFSAYTNANLLAYLVRLVCSDIVFYKRINDLSLHLVTGVTRLDCNMKRCVSILESTHLALALT